MTESSHTPRWAFVTGASAGIGEALAREFAARGTSVHLVARRTDRLERLANELKQTHGVQALWTEADLASRAGLRRVLDAVDRMQHPPDVFVNNAGFGAHVAALDHPSERALDMVVLNVEVVTTLTLELIRRFRETGRGTVINVASTAAFQPVPFMAVYGATKAYVLSFSEAVDAELAGSGVRVMTACPGYIETEFQAVANSNMPALAKAAIPVAVFARRCVDAFERGDRTYIDGVVNKLGAMLARFTPRSIVLGAQKRVMRPR